MDQRNGTETSNSEPVYGNFKLVSDLKANGLIEVRKYQSVKTGLKVVIGQVGGPVVNGYFTLATEAFDDDGLPHTLEHLIFLGSEDYPFKGVLDLVANRMLASGSNAWTDTDHTCYTVTTAGSEGFLSLMPIYLDHILYPTLTESGYVTEVHHINGEGKDAGVVYCEMQGRENSGESRTYLELIRESYPGKCGYKSETGGIMKNLRESTSNEKVRCYHKEFYRPDNLTLIITGQVKDEDVFKVLEPLENKIISKGSLKPFKRPWQSPVPELKESKDLLVLYPSDVEDNGMVYVGWRGPSAVTEFYEMSACSILLKYLTDTSISPLQRDFVEIEDPFASSVSYNLLENSVSLLHVVFENVPTAKLALIKDHLFKTLKGIDDGTEPINMKRLKTVISRQKLETLMNLENHRHDSIAFMVIGDMLYGNTEKDLNQRLNPITDLNRMFEEPEEFWRNLLRKYLIEGPNITVRGKPSLDEQSRMAKEEEERVEKQKQLLGPEGLLKKEKQLNEAVQNNEIPPPEEMLTKLPIPDSTKINFHSIKSYSTESTEQCEKFNTREVPIFMYLDDLQTNFVYMVLIMDTEALTRDLRPYLLLFLESILESPIQRGDKLVPYEEVVSELEEDTVAISTRIGLEQTARFTCGPYCHSASLILQVEPKKYTKAITWIKELLFHTKFTKDRIKIIANKIINDVAQRKRNGKNIARDVISGLCYNKDNNHYWTNVLRQHKFLTELVEKLESETACQSVLEDIETVRSLLTSPSNIIIHMAANLESLAGKVGNLASAWTGFLPEGVIPLRLRLPVVPDWLFTRFFCEDIAKKLELSDLEQSLEYLSFSMGPRFKVAADNTYLETEKENLKPACIVGMGCIESAYLCQAVPSITDYSDADLPALLVFLQYLTQLEGAMWKQIRGQGLSYSYSMYPYPNEGLLFLVFFKSTNVFASYKEAKAIVDAHLKEDAKFDNTLLDSAKSSMIFEIVDLEKSVGDVFVQSVQSYFKNVDHDFNKNLVGKVSKVTTEDLVRVGGKYIAPLFDPAQCRLSIVCHPTKADEIADGFKGLNFDVQVYKSLEESFLNEW